MQITKIKTMRQQIADWIDEERAVSPVIGVILMVAITVILAAVIGTFVLDLGQSAGQSAPQASLSVSVDASNHEVTVEHTGGDAIDQSQTRVIIENSSAGKATWEPATESGTMSVGGSTTYNVSDNSTSTGDLMHSTTSFTGGFNVSAGDQITITLIDTASQRQIFETTVTA